MAEYDLGALSPYEFERLVRDLFQKHKGIFFESFKQGKDKGIDLRHCLKNKKIIIQCKHYFKSSYGKLKSDLEKERVKVQKLDPSEYIIVTSCELSPDNKTEIKKIFEPFCHSDSDIYGRMDILNLLQIHDDIAQKNYKLWFTSDVVLRKILHNRLFNQTEIDIKKFRRFLPKMVITKSYRRVERSLEKNGVCVISGQPGVGKSTLMRWFVLKYTAKGYEPYKIREDIGEAHDLFNDNNDRKQIFYYDDFLGQTFSQNMRKNEDQEIITFIDEISKIPNKKIILATREHILNQTKNFSEVISKVEKYKAIIKLSDFSQMTKAQILYNHLWHSNLDAANILDILERENYKKIINHENFNPRIIEWMTTKDNISSDNYFQTFLYSLDHPNLIWQHAYENQISEYSKMLIFVLTSFPIGVDKELLFTAYIALKKSISDKKINELSLSSEFNKSIKEMDGTFIYSDISQNKIEISFCNPSVKDFMNNLLLSNKTYLSNLCYCVISVDQVINIWNLLERSGENQDYSNHIDLNRYLTSINQLLDLESKRLYPYNDFNRLLLHLIHVTQVVKLKNYIDSMNDALIELIDKINNEELCPNYLYEILCELKKDPSILQTDWNTLIRVVKKNLFSKQPSTTRDFVQIIDFVRKIGLPISIKEFGEIKYRIIQVLKAGIEFEISPSQEIEIFMHTPEDDEIQHVGTGILDLNYLIQELEKIGPFFDIEVDDMIQEIQSRIDDHYSHFEDSDETEDDLSTYNLLKEDQEIKIDMLFESLIEKI